MTDASCTHQPRSRQWVSDWEGSNLTQAPLYLSLAPFLTPLPVLPLSLSLAPFFADRLCRCPLAPFLAERLFRCRSTSGAGFTLKSCPTKCADFRDDEEVVGTYYAEMMELVKQTSGGTQPGSRPVTRNTPHGGSIHAWRLHR